MKIIFITDTHFRSEPGFFEAGKEFCKWFIDDLKKEFKPFILIHGGDVYHRSQETGDVNQLVVQFFSQLADLTLCKKIIVITGNHDVKKETGSALKVIQGLNQKIHVCEEPELLQLEGDKYLYALPHFVPFGKVSVHNYSDPEFHHLSTNPYLVSCHAGDETTGFFKSVDLSSIPGKKCNGDIHKRVSPNYPGAALVTRRDERDRQCFYRVFDLENDSMREIEIPLFLNFVQVDYGVDLRKHLDENPSIAPLVTCFVDIIGHDSPDAVLKEYQEIYGEDEYPRYYFDKVVPPDRRGELDDIDAEASELDSEVDIRDQFDEFCSEKKIKEEVATLVREKL